jgi:hypothetical protein
VGRGQDPGWWHVLWTRESTCLGRVLSWMSEQPQRDGGLAGECGVQVALRRIWRVPIATEILLNFLFWQMKVVAFVTRGPREIKT